MPLPGIQHGWASGIGNNPSKGVFSGSYGYIMLYHMTRIETYESTKIGEPQIWG